MTAVVADLEYNAFAAELGDREGESAGLIRPHPGPKTASSQALRMLPKLESRFKLLAESSGDQSFGLKISMLIS